jgi:putative nucleotidyltransferase with HDIG domain
MSGVRSKPAELPPDANAIAFEFVKNLAAELSTGKVELPSFPDIAVRVRRVLADDKTTIDQVVRIVGSEAALAARLLKMANSAALNRSGKQLTDLRAAINRMGYNMVRSAAITFAMAQIRLAHTLKELEPHLEALWKHSAYVAATCYTIARKFSTINPDEALLTGLLHGIGKLYILTRASAHPELFRDPAALEQIMRDWHASIGKAILENWEFAEQMTNAIAEHEDITRDHAGAVDLTDIVTVGNMMAAFADNSGNLELNLQGIRAFERMKLDGSKCVEVMQESQEEITALRQALGS